MFKTVFENWEYNLPTPDCVCNSLNALSGRFRNEPNTVAVLMQAQELIRVLEKNPRVVYECDHRACSGCNPDRSMCSTVCHMTKDIAHARNFEMNPDGNYYEEVF